MSNTSQETIADIVAKMRKDIAEGTVGIWSDFGGEIASGYADRIDEAHQREVAVLRKGISELLDALQAIYNEECTGYGTGEVYDKWRKALKSSQIQIESVWNHHFREVTKMVHSEQVGNAEAMRETLEICASMGEQIDYQLGSSEETVYALRYERCLAHNISECARAALSSPPRNCDVLSKDEVLEMLKDRSFSKEDTIEWLYDEAKGITDGSK